MSFDHSVPPGLQKQKMQDFFHKMTEEEKLLFKTDTINLLVFPGYQNAFPKL